MLYFDRIDVSEWIDVNKSNETRKCIIAIIMTFYTILSYFLLSFCVSISCYYFLCRFQASACDDCHNSIHKAMNFNDGAIACVKGNDHRSYFGYINKDEAINIMNKTSWSKKVDFCKIWKFMKEAEKKARNYYHQEDGIEKAKEYYENSKERL